MFAEPETAGRSRRDGCTMPGRCSAFAESILTHHRPRHEERWPRLRTHCARRATSHPCGRIVALDNGMYRSGCTKLPPMWRIRCCSTTRATMGAGLRGNDGRNAVFRTPGARESARRGFMMNSQEMETAVSLKLNLVVLSWKTRPTA